MGAVAAVPGGQHDRQRLLALLAGQVQLRGQPAPRAAQRVVGRLDAHTTGRFLLKISLAARPGSVLVRPGDGGVHADVPAVQIGGVSAACSPTRICAQTPARCQRRYRP
jgi:hypothetical protein